MNWTEVSTHLIAFLVGASTGAAGKYLADRFTDQRHRQEACTETTRRFERVLQAMPALIAEMKADLAQNEFVREFVVLPAPTVVYNSSHTVFSYYEDQHEDLRGKIVLLEGAGYVADHSTRSNPLFRMSDSFVEQIKQS